MDTHLTVTRETHSPPPDSVDFSPNSPFPPPTETLDDLGNSFAVPEVSNLHYLPCQDEDLDDPAVSLLFDIESPKDEEQEDNPLSPSPINTYSGYSPRWSSRYGSGWSAPWPSSKDAKASTSHLSELWEKRSSSISPVWLDEKPSMVGAGLENLGNTCFLNAIMQCFTHTVPLVQGLISSVHPISCDRNNNGFCVLCAFRSHIEVSLASTGRDISPWKFVENLSHLSSNFQRYQQEDAHEFLQCFLDRLDSCCSDTKTKDMTLAAQDGNFVNQAFGGRLVSKLKCCNCGHFSDTYEPSIDLSLEIEDVSSLQTALESFTKVEKIEDQETKFTCENCKEKVSIEKQLVLDRTPTVAAFHLKRFKHDGSYVEKIDKFVEFPLELDLQPYAKSAHDTTVELKYDLCAVVVHIGFSSTSGHYYCFIRSAPDTWYKFDDSKVVRVQEDYVLSQEAYILFYAKQGTPWFSSYLETLKPFLDSDIFNTSPKSVLDNLDICTSSSGNATNHIHDVSETSDAGDEIRMESPSELRHDWGNGNKDRDDTRRISTTLPLSTSNSSNGTFNIEKVFPPSVLQVKSLNQVDITTNADNSPRSRPISPSPDIYKDESPEVGVSIKRDHLKLVNHLSCKNQFKKGREASETKEARRYLKSMPGARSRTLLAAMERPHSKGSQNKRRRMEMSPHKDDTPSRICQKAGLKSLMRPLAAGCFR